jgi:excisionase family DNA binding protein
MLLSTLSDTSGETTAAKSVLDLIGLTEEVGAAVRAKAQDDFEALGLTLKSFYIGNLKPSSKSAQELRDMGMLDMATYTQLQAADAMRDAASNPSGGAGLTAGIGAGMGIGNLMQQATSGAVQGGQKQESSSSGAAASKGIPDVMTPSEVAAILKVSEEDVIAAINDKSLRARKMGNAYRISKNALEEFLNS